MVKRKEQHFKVFLQNAQSPRTEEKLNLAGKNPGNSRTQKVIARLPEPELFEEPHGQVTPVKIRRTGNDADTWQVGY